MVQTRTANILGAVVALGAAGGVIGYLLWKHPELFGTAPPVSPGTKKEAPTAPTTTTPTAPTTTTPTGLVPVTTSPTFAPYATPVPTVPVVPTTEYAPVPKTTYPFTQPTTYPALVPGALYVQPVSEVVTETYADGGGVYGPLQTAAVGTYEVNILLKSCWWGGGYEGALVAIGPAVQGCSTSACTQRTYSGLTDSNGIFRVKVPKGRYSVEVWTKGKSDFSPSELLLFIDVPVSGTNIYPVGCL